MSVIQLPLTPAMRRLAWGLILACSLLLLGSRLAWSWRVGGAALVLAGGGLLWQRYERRRPLALRVASDGGLQAILAGGRVVAIRRVKRGVVHPRLISARLYGADGGRRDVSVDLFVPGRSLSPGAHWRLRRALVGFRAAGEGAARPGDPARDSAT